MGIDLASLYSSFVGDICKETMAIPGVPIHGERNVNSVEKIPGTRHSRNTSAGKIYHQTVGYID